MKFLKSLIFLTACTVSLNAMGGAAESDRLASVLAAQPEENQARFAHRHPQETLEFFEIEPGMTVMEALPGSGWYTRILLPYLGSEGHVIGADYSMDMYPLFGFFNEEWLAEHATWTTDFPASAAEWTGEDGAGITAFVFGSMPEEMKETADAVLLIRALHNLARFEGDGGFLSAALTDVNNVLKPGGIVGVVQHEARADMPDDWAGGANGYLKRDFVIAKMKEFGFEFVGSSDINRNEKDQPTDSDIVWRLPPSLATSRENPELRAELEAVGESNRMTLKFRKPE